MRSPLAIACLAALCLSSCIPVLAPTRPNVLLIVADDLGFNDLGANNGNPKTHTPALDHLASQGVRFSQHYADAVCSPARAALLTGQNPARLGYTPNGRGLSPQVLTLAESLQEAGYATVHIGKWHIGDTLREAWPDRQGFAHWFGFLNQWFLAGVQREGGLALAPPRHRDPWLVRDGDAGARYSGEVDDVLSEEAVRQLTSLGATGQPWFINLWYYSPHAPITPDPRFAALEPDSPEGRYRAMVRQLDANVERVLRALDETGQRNRTLVVFVSDNGGTAHEATDSNWPFYGTKATYWEGGLRTPMLIRWPDGKAAGSVRGDPVAIQDIYPTILAHLRIPQPPGLDGQDIGKGPTAKRDLFWETYFAGRYAYSLLRNGDLRLYNTWPWTPREAPSKLVDVEPNPSAPRNIAAERPDVLAQMEGSRRAIQSEMHRPTLSFRRDLDGSGVLAGQDFLRTPGFGGFAFGIRIDTGYAGTVATQNRIWSLKLGPDRKLLADFQGHRLEGSMTGPGCHTVWLSGWFSRRSTNWKGDDDRVALSLFVDGVRADTIDEPGRLDDTYFSEPTRTGLPGNPTMNALLGEPVLLIAPIDASDASSPEALHRELCSRS
jgi:arylsulfatase A-like enzyme